MWWRRVVAGCGDGMWRRVCVWRRVYVWGRVCGTHELRSLRMGNAVILIFVWLLAVTVPRCLGPRQGLGDGDAMSRAKARVGRRTGNIGALQWRRTHGKAPASKRYSAPGMWHPTVTAQCHGNKAGSGALRVRVWCVCVGWLAHGVLTTLASRVARLQSSPGEVRCLSLLVGAAEQHLRVRQAHEQRRVVHELDMVTGQGEAARAR